MVNSCRCEGAGSTEHRLRHDIALHFVGAAVNGGLAHVEVGRSQWRQSQSTPREVALPTRLHRLRDEGHGVGARREHHQLGVALLDFAAPDLE